MNANSGPGTRIRSAWRSCSDFVTNFEFLPKPNNNVKNNQIEVSRFALLCVA